MCIKSYGANVLPFRSTYSLNFEFNIAREALNIISIYSFNMHLPKFWLEEPIKLGYGNLVFVFISIMGGIGISTLTVLREKMVDKAEKRQWQEGPKAWEQSGQIKPTFIP